jgi:hypothetical protein
MNPAIKSFSLYRPTEQWIRENSGNAWVKLDIDVPYDVISQEAQAVFARSVEHREYDKVAGHTNQGWRSVCLHGISSESTGKDDTGNAMTWTDVSSQCPITVDFVKQYWQEDTAGRVRFMWLAPNGHIMPHVDREHAMLFECNVAIDHPDQCAVQFMDRGCIPFESGSAFMIDTSYRHFAYNDSHKWRVHLIVHARLKPGILQRSYEKSFYS